MKRILKALVRSHVITDCSSHLCLCQDVYTLYFLAGSFKHRTPTFLDHADKTAISEADKQLRLLSATPISLSQFLFLLCQFIILFYNHHTLVQGL